MSSTVPAARKQPVERIAGCAKPIGRPARRGTADKSVSTNAKRVQVMKFTWRFMPAAPFSSAISYFPEKSIDKTCPE